MDSLLNESLRKEFIWAMRYIDNAALSKSSQKRARIALSKMDKVILTITPEAPPHGE